MVLMVAVGGLATARLTRLVVADEILEPVRRRLLVRLDPDNGFHQKLVYLATCQWCVSMWIGTPVAAAILTFPDSWVTWSVLLTLAFSQITGILGVMESHYGGSEENVDR